MLEDSILTLISIELDYVVIVIVGILEDFIVSNLRVQNMYATWEIDLYPSKRIWGCSNSALRHSNTRSTMLKLIYIISSIYKLKIKCFEYFLSIYQVGEKQTAYVVSWLV